MEKPTIDMLLEKEFQQHDVWLATRFRVAAPTYQEASAQAVAWLKKRLASGAAGRDEDAANVSVSVSAQTLHDAAVLAIKLLALEEKGGDALRRVEQLRADIDAEAAESAASAPDRVSR